MNRREWMQQSFRVGAALPLLTWGSAHSQTPAAPPGNLLILIELKGANDGLKADRMPYSKKTGFYYILSAKEMWLYMSANFGAPHQSWPKSGAFKDSADFQKNFDSTIKPVVSARKGVVAFDKIFGYSGTGHVDIFDGEKLSDSPSWYGCQRLKVWYISA